MQKHISVSRILSVCLIAYCSFAADVSMAMDLPYKSKMPFGSSVFGDSKFGYVWFEVGQDGNGIAYLRLSNGAHLQGILKGGVSLGFFDGSDHLLKSVTLSGEVSDLLPGAKTKAKNFSAKFFLSPDDWKKVSRVGHRFIADTPPEGTAPLDVKMWTLFTF